MTNKSSDNKLGLAFNALLETLHQLKLIGWQRVETTPPYRRSEVKPLRVQQRIVNGDFKLILYPYTDKRRDLFTHEELFGDQ